MHVLIERFRFLCAWWRWASRRRREVAGLEALFTEPAPSAYPIPLPNCQACRPEPVDHRELGRGDLSKETITEVAAWLEASGWAGEDAGRLQVYAAWLIKQRAAYERGEVKAT